MLPSIFVYAGLITTALGLLGVLKPLRWIGIRCRRHAMFSVCAGVLLIAAGCMMPAPTIRVASPRTQLDRFAPVYQFSELHSTRVNAPPERVYRAIKEVSVDEFPVIRTIKSLRPASSRRESILVELATRTSFLLLADEPSREIVIGKVVRAPRGPRLQRAWLTANYTQMNGPGLALATMNFRVEDAGSGATTLTTETRVYATDAPTQKAFARYWRVIYPGSALLRRMWLSAIKRRAESYGQP